jgi:hypothetical protein
MLHVVIPKLILFLPLQVMHSEVNEYSIRLYVLDMCSSVVQQSSVYLVQEIRQYPGFYVLRTMKYLQIAHTIMFVIYYSVGEVYLRQI